MSIPTEAGVVEVVDSVLICRSSHYGLWSLPIHAIQKIEEYGHPDGPFIDDYFYRFFTATGEERTASFSAAGWDQVWPELQKAFPGIDYGGLCDSTEFRIRVLWPISNEEPHSPMGPC